MVRVDLPANPRHDDISDRELFYEHVQLDKGRRLLAGMLAAGPTGYFMLVDDDDFVHRDIAGFVEDNFGGNGWVLRSGYVWNDGGRLLFLHPKFSMTCGTSHIARSDLYRLPGSARRRRRRVPPVDARQPQAHREAAGGTRHTAFELPFPGAVYRVGHSGSHSRSTAILPTYVLKRSVLADPWRLARALGRLRLLGPSCRATSASRRASGARVQDWGAASAATSRPASAASISATVSGTP